MDGLSPESAGMYNVVHWHAGGCQWIVLVVVGSMQSRLVETRTPGQVVALAPNDATVAQRGDYARERCSVGNGR